ncbi:MAG: ABC transporter permease subunit [Sphaerochaetaceae bacterium]
MMRSITQDKPRKKKIAWWSILVWLAVWQVAAMAIGEPLLLASPIQVIGTLASLAGTAAFYSEVLFSFVRIAAGFFLAAVAAVILASEAFRHSAFESLVEPLMRIIRSIPVASFIILVLVWISSRNLSIMISFLIVLPVIYSSTLEGLKQTDSQLLEMASVFRVKQSSRIRYIYIPEAFPYFRSACSVSLGLAWKSGIAAEVIGMPLGSMGERLYQAKIFLDTPALLAWTVAIVLVSYGFEKLVLLLLDLVRRRVER